MRRAKGLCTPQLGSQAAWDQQQQASSSEAQLTERAARVCSSTGSRRSATAGRRWRRISRKICCQHPNFSHQTYCSMLHLQ